MENIRGAKALAEDALQELLDENYTFEEKYVEEFGTTDYVFTITNGAELQERMDTLYLDFSSWLGAGKCEFHGLPVPGTPDFCLL